MTDLTKQIEEILNQHSNYVYYEGDPMRGGISLEEATKQILSLLSKTLESVVGESEGVNWKDEPELRKRKDTRNRLRQEIRDKLKEL